MPEAAVGILPVGHDPFCRARGLGKRGGVRVIYFTQLAAGQICLLLIYAKSAQDNISPAVLREIRKEIESHED